MIDGTPPIQIDRDSPVPIAVQLAEQLAWLIATRALAPGDPLPSIRTLAASLGVHHHTVRQVYKDLQGDGLISIRHGSGATIQAFSPLQLARVQSVRGVPTVGVLIAGFNPFYLPFLRGIQRASADARSLTIASVTEDNPDKARLQIGQLLAAGVRGIIVASVGQVTRDELAADQEQSIVPVVYCDQPDQVEESFVFDAPAAGYELASHLAAHGHRRLTFIAPSLDLPNLAALHNGYQRAIADGLIEGIDFIRSDSFSIEAGERAGTEALTTVPRPTAVATAADELALGVLSAAQKLQLPVPEAVALVSYGEIEAARFVQPSITTVALPVEEMGVLAARRLTALLRADPPSGVTLMRADVIVRQSCGQHDASRASAEHYERR
jgi:DNA-binding LacI/PurR family transcriptional regulator